MMANLILDLAPDLSLEDEEIAFRADLDTQSGRLTLWGFAPAGTFDREVNKWSGGYKVVPDLPHLIATLDVSQARMLRSALDLFIGDIRAREKEKAAAKKEAGTA